MRDDARYTMKPLMKRLQTTARTLRFYEEKGLVKPQREGGRRVYSAADVERLEHVLDWTAAGISLREAKAAMALLDQGDVTNLTKFLRDKLLSLELQHTKRLEHVYGLQKELARI